MCYELWWDITARYQSRVRSAGSGDDDLWGPMWRMTPWRRFSGVAQGDLAWLQLR
jgi:hypothetical protein